MATIEDLKIRASEKLSKVIIKGHTVDVASSDEDFILLTVKNNKRKDVGCVFFHKDMLRPEQNFEEVFEKRLNEFIESYKKRFLCKKERG